MLCNYCVVLDKTPGRLTSDKHDVNENGLESLSLFILQFLFPVILANQNQA